MSRLDASGASLYYEKIGSGPVLLCITGAGGDVEFWKPLAEQLKDAYTLILYDRRGFSRSHLIGAQDYIHRIETDADDVAELLKAVSAGKEAVVLANSSGALVGLEVLVRHADLVSTVIAHEPPAHRFLPEWEEIKEGASQLYQIYRDSGLEPALDIFAQAIKLNEHETAALKASMDPRSGPYAYANAMYWMEREVLYYPSHEFDLAALEKNKEKLVLLNGTDTDPQAGHYRPNVVLAEKLGLEVQKADGGHLGAVSHSAAFADAVKGILSAR